MTSVFIPDKDKVLDANEFLDTCSDKEYFEFRRELEENRKTTPVALCNVCFQPVVLRATSQRTTFFAHPKNSEDCPIKTTSIFTQEEIRAMLFNGQKEGRAHKENKQLLADYLIADRLFDDEVRIEPTFREKNNVGVAKKWRRPDISSVFKEGRKDVVFELQVNTTFLDVIIQRENFYRDNDTYIVWVFLSFDPKQFTTLDIGYANKANIFVLDDEAKQKSEKEDQLYLTCHYQVPYMQDDLDVGYEWNSCLVEFSELTFDIESKKVYAVDTTEIDEQVHQTIKVELARIEQEQIEMEAERERLKKKEEDERKAEAARIAKIVELAQENRRTSPAFDPFRIPSTSSRSSSSRGKNSYANRREQSTFSHATPESKKSFGDTVLCPKCSVRAKPKKVGNSPICSNCMSYLGD